MMAQLLLLGTNFVNFIGYDSWIGEESGVEAVQVTEWDERQTVITEAPILIMGAGLRSKSSCRDPSAGKRRGRDLQIDPPELACIAALHPSSAAALLIEVQA